MKRIILDLCAGTGGWSQPYVDAGYDVRRYDLLHGTGECLKDIRLLEYPTFPVHGILAAPPCTVFAASGNRWPRSERDMADGLSVVDACLRLVVVCRPQWWVLENPVGKLKRYLGPPTMRFDPCDYGDPYTKKTLLWGNFTPPMKTPCLPLDGSKMHTRFGGKSQRTKTLRSETPLGFAAAFFNANP